MEKYNADVIGGCPSWVNKTVKKLVFLWSFNQAPVADTFEATNVIIAEPYILHQAEKIKKKTSMYMYNKGYHKGYLDGTDYKIKLNNRRSNA